jgi:hypothetical protein
MRINHFRVACGGWLKITPTDIDPKSSDRCNDASCFNSLLMVCSLEGEIRWAFRHIDRPISTPTWFFYPSKFERHTPQTNRYYISPSPRLIEKQTQAQETFEANQRPAISSSKFSRVFLLFWCCAPSDAEHSGLQLFRFGHFLHCYIRPSDWLPTHDRT